MIDRPEIANPVWNPLVTFQFGRTNQDTTCIMLNFQGETGEKTTLIFEDTDSVRNVIEMLECGVEMMKTAQTEGFEGAVEAFGGDPDPEMLDIPDDISSLFDE